MMLDNFGLLAGKLKPRDHSLPQNRWKRKKHDIAVMMLSEIPFPSRCSWCFLCLFVSFELDNLFKVAIGLGTAPWHAANIIKPIVNCRDLDGVAVRSTLGGNKYLILCLRMSKVQATMAKFCFSCIQLC